MDGLPSLAAYLERSVARFPDCPAVVGPDGKVLTYRELDETSARLAGHLAARGVGPGDRVGIVLPKSVESVIAIFGVLRAGAAYVPADFRAPPDRVGRILSDCGVTLAFLAIGVVEGLAREGGLPARIVAVPEAPGLEGWAEAVGAEAPRRLPSSGPGDLAYLLYTSGSTGVPKGVSLTHGNATSFIDWCSSVFRPTESDRFSSHAPFHFDLSVLDLFLAIKHGASVHLIDEDTAQSPRLLLRFLTARQLTVWYSTPSVLALMTQFGGIDRTDSAALRLVLFAGEVFPIKHLRRLTRAWPRPEYYNLYGPTETNVCTFARIPGDVPEDRTDPYPIGFPCAHCKTRVLDETGRDASAGEEGLLHVAGPSVFGGYWGRPAESAAAFLERDGERWYNTGDVVREEEGEGLVYVGRRDRMVKRRGYRIELGEIEAGLYRHENLREAAAIAVPGPDGAAVVAFVVLRGEAPSIVSLKAFCACVLPAYMTPDRFLFLDALPRTSTDKVDYQALLRLASGT